MTKKVNRPHKKRGFPPRQPPAAVPTPVLVEALAADGRDMIGVAAAFATSTDTLRRWMDENADLHEAFKRGRERERQALHNKLYRAAMNGNTVAAIFLLKSRHGYREGDQSDTANKVSITFTLPAAVKPEDFAKVVEHEPANTNKPVPAARIARS
jgi:hypothetical protein